MQKNTRWIVIGATGTLGLGLVAGGALTAANAFEIRDANGVTVATVPTSTPGVGSDVSPTSDPATPAASDASDTMTPTASPVTSSPSSPMTSSPTSPMTSSPMTVSPPSPVTPATPPTPPTPGSVD